MTEEQSQEPIFELIEDLAPPDLYAQACKICAGSGWYFGHASNANDTAQFWKMELTSDPIFNAIWQSAKSRCEAFAGTPLRVVRQYANGHTYGLGGKTHVDDVRPGSFTLLYYPMPEWKAEWEGETVFEDGGGEAIATVRPRPNRAVFFDSRIPHAGRAPSRACQALRVTVAYKLEAIPSEVKALEVAANPLAESAGIITSEAERDGWRRVYKTHVPAAHVESLVATRLVELGKSVRLPGFRPGKIPTGVLQQRYGVRTRTEVINRIAAEAADRLFTSGGLASQIDILAGAAAGAVELSITLTHLPDLADLDFSKASFERLSASTETLAAVGVDEADAEELFRDHLRQQVMDYLDAAYAFPIAPALVDNEFAGILSAAEKQVEGPASESIVAELRVIAERRVRLGAVVAELGRRFEIPISAADLAHFREGDETVTQTRSRLVEDRVVDRLLANAHIVGREVSVDELRELAEA